MLFTPKDLAKIGMAGMINPKPTATKKATAVRTETSLGNSDKGDVNLLIIRAPLPQNPHEPPRNRLRSVMVSHGERVQI